MLLEEEIIRLGELGQQIAVNYKPQKPHVLGEWRRNILKSRMFFLIAVQRIVQRLQRISEHGVVKKKTTTKKKKQKPKNNHQQSTNKCSLINVGFV